MDKAQAQVVARKWIAAFNDHDLETILSHYTESVELTSLFVTKLLDVPPYEFLLE
ncbi:MAG: nuclear transport factor 2 family protein [Syntrophales bacterium]|nr:nuclear transport factor 2 family protein [Syntrophales bacterium]